MSLLLPVEGVPGVHDSLTNERSGATGYTRDQATGRVRATAPLTGRPMLVDFNEGADASDGRARPASPPSASCRSAKSSRAISSSSARRTRS